MFPLKPGTYIIQNVATSAYVGRDLKEDKSLHPKKVLFQVVSEPQRYDFCVLRCTSCSPSLTFLTILVARPTASKWHIHSQGRISCHRAYQERGLRLPLKPEAHRMADHSRKPRWGNQHL